MILPGKHLRADRSLVSVGGEILAQLAEPRSVSEVWEGVRARRAANECATPLTYDWFVLALSFLNAISAVRLEDGVLVVERTS